MKILHFVYIMNRGGQETLVMNLFRNINRKEFQFDVLTVSDQPGDFDDEIRSLGGNVYHLPRKRIFLMSIIDFFRKHRDFDVLHIHNRHAYSVLLQIIGARLGGVRKIVVHSHSSDAPNRPLHLVCRPLLRLFHFRKLACSDVAATWLYGKKPRKVTLIKNGIDTRKFCFSPTDRQNTREALGLKEKQMILLHIGRFYEAKNHTFLLDIFREIRNHRKDAILLLAGEGELLDKMRKKVSDLRLQDSVRFLGLRTDIPQLLSAADIFLFPSLYEGLPLTLIEAQCSGIPCHISDTISPEAVLSPDCQVHSLDIAPAQWAEAILATDLSTDRSTGPGILRNAGFDIRTVARELEDIYQGQR